jgi:aminoglycoside phosphotransferase (APT) family kinase protein
LDSFSKITLSAESARSIVAHHFGSSTRLVHFAELKEGFFNAAALLELSDGQKLVLKAAPPAEVRVLRYETDLLRAEVEAMRLVAERTAVPVPAVRVYDPTCVLLPSPFFLMDFLPGVPYHKLRPSLSPAEQASVAFEMGRLTAALGAVTGPAFGYWAQPCLAGVSWRECFAAMARGVLQDGLDAEVDLDLPYPEIYARMEAHFAVLDEVRTPRLVHWDLWDGNVFVDPATLRVSGLIDFERVLWGDPLIEAVFGDIDNCADARAGFGLDPLATPEARTRRLLYNVYLHLIMVIECTYRRYPTPDQENWVRPILRAELASLAAR